MSEMVSARQAEVRLRKLEVEIRAAYQQAHEAALTTVKYAIRCGRMLSEAKQLQPHGSFQRYVIDNCHCHPNTARLYMRVAEKYPELSEKLGDSVDKMSLNELDAFIRKHLTDNPRLPKQQSVVVLPEEDCPVTPEYDEVEDVPEEYPQDDDATGKDLAEPEGDCKPEQPYQQPPPRHDPRPGNHRGGSGAGDQRTTTCRATQQLIDQIQQHVDHLNTTCPHSQLHAIACSYLDGLEQTISKWERYQGDA